MPLMNDPVVASTLAHAGRPWVPGSPSKVTIQIGNGILVSAMSARERARGRAPTRLNVALIFVVPAAVAAVTLWLTASINR